MAKTPPSRVSTSRILADLRLAARKGDRSALALAVDQMRTLAHSPRYWERYLGLLRNPLARLVDLLTIKQGDRIAHQKGWKLPRPAPAAPETQAGPWGPPGAAHAAPPHPPPAGWYVPGPPPAPRRDQGAPRRQEDVRAAAAFGRSVAVGATLPLRVSRAVVVVNEAAGGGRTRRLWQDLRDDLRRLGLVFDWAPTTGRGTAIDLARAAAEGGAPLVVAVGGDGTLNEVVNGATRETGPSPVVGVVLTGRGCDAARNLGLSTDVRAAARALVEGVDTRFDLIRAEWPDGARRLVVTAAGAGFDASVARRTATGGGRGTRPYLRGIVATLASHRNGMCATVSAAVHGHGGTRGGPARCDGARAACRR